MRRFLVLVLVLSATAAAADHDPNRPTDLISADLNISEEMFLTCFEPVMPDPGKDPSGERQRANKDLLLGCLQNENPEITNSMLDRVMDTYRPEGSILR